MTNADMRADTVISPALQNVLLMLSASEAQGLPAVADLLQHLVPSQKHLTMLHRHVQVYVQWRQGSSLVAVHCVLATWVFIHATCPV